MTPSLTLHKPVTVFIPGVWDLLHVGHVNVLRRARSLGDRLVVGVPSDEVVREDKGKYPVIPLAQRVQMLEAIRYVDEVVTYHKLEFLTPLEKINPDIMAVGSTWGKDRRHTDAEEWLRWHHKRLIIVPYTKGISTTSIIKRIKEERC